MSPTEVFTFGEPVRKRFKHLFNPDESNVYLCVGASFLFTGIFHLNQSAGIITVGIIFIGIGFIQAQQEGNNGTP